MGVSRILSFYNIMNCRECFFLVNYFTHHFCEIEHEIIEDPENSVCHLFVEVIRENS